MIGSSDVLHSKILIVDDQEARVKRVSIGLCAETKSVSFFFNNDMGRSPICPYAMRLRP